MTPGGCLHPGETQARGRERWARRAASLAGQGARLQSGAVHGGHRDMGCPHGERGVGVAPGVPQPCRAPSSTQDDLITPWHCLVPAQLFPALSPALTLLFSFPTYFRSDTESPRTGRCCTRCFAVHGQRRCRDQILVTAAERGNRLSDSLSWHGGGNEPGLSHPRAEVPRGRQQQQQLSAPGAFLASHHFILTASAHLIKGSSLIIAPAAC